MFIAPCVIAIVDEWKTNLMSLAILFHLLCTLHISDSSSVHHHDFSLYTQQWYMSYKYVYIYIYIYICGYLLSICTTWFCLMFIGPCIIAIVDEWKTNLMSLATLFHLLCTLHVSDSSSVHHQDFSLYTQQWYMSYSFADSLRELSSCHQTCMTYTIAVCTVLDSWWRTEKLSYSKNKFEKLVHLFGFIIRIIPSN